MKKIYRNLVCAAVVMTISMFAAGVCLADDSRQGHGRMVGTWDAVITIRDCSSGFAITSFASIANFNLGGTFLGSSAGRPQASRTPEHGVWEHVSGRKYRFRFKTFSFDPNGVAVSYSILTHDLKLDRSSDSYFSEGMVKHYAMDGTQIGQGCSDGVGTRFTL